MWRWRIVVICFFILCACASQANEAIFNRSELAEIEKLDADGSVQSLGEDIVALDEQAYLLESKKAEDELLILNMMTIVKGMSAQLVSSISNGEDKSQELMRDIGMFSRNIKVLKGRIKYYSENLSEIFISLRSKSKLLFTRREHIRKKKVMLREGVLERLRGLSRGVVERNYSGKFQCNTSMSLAHCIDDSGRKKLMLDEVRVNIDSPWDVGEFLQSKLIDANMNINGVVDYRMRVQYRQIIGQKLLKYVNEQLGLTQVILTVHSNDSVEYFVDGRKMGEGNELSIPIDIGMHSIYVRSSKGAASVMRAIGEDMKLYLPIRLPQKNISSESSSVRPPTMLSPSVSSSLNNRALMSHYVKLNNKRFFVPVSIAQNDDTYLDQENSFLRLSFNSATSFCFSNGGRIATQMEYMEALNSSEFPNAIGLKSSFWLNQNTVLSRMGEGVLGKRVSNDDKYIILCADNSLVK